MLSFGADPNVKDRPENAAIDTVRSAANFKSLLKANTKDNLNSRIYKRSTMHRLVKQNCLVEILECLATAGFKLDFPDAYDETSLVVAIFKGYFGLAKYLIEAGANVSAIHFTAFSSAVQILPLLLKRHATYNTVNRFGRNIG